MLRNLIQKSLLLNSKSELRVVVAKSQSASLLHTSSVSLSSKDHEDIDYEMDRSNGIKNLEKLGLAKAEWSWPKYNRTIFPPSADGVPLINPVISLLHLN